MFASLDIFIGRLCLAPTYRVRKDWNNSPDSIQQCACIDDFSGQKLLHNASLADKMLYTPASCVGTWREMCPDVGCPPFKPATRTSSIILKNM